jgi:hypothetical protein
MMEKVKARMTIDIYVECPNKDCLADINLMNPDDTCDYDHNDCGDLLKQSCPSEGHWADSHEKFNAEDVTCGWCKTKFNVEGLDW